MPSINQHELITAIKSGLKYETIAENLNVSKRTIIRYAKKYGEQRRAENGKPQYNNGERKFKGERITAHYYFSKPTAKDSFIYNYF